MSSRSRNSSLELMRILLTSPDGEILLEELKAEWSPLKLLGTDPQHTGYLVGKRDAYEYLMALKNGDMIHE
jgi:hypothetical protein